MLAYFDFCNKSPCHYVAFVPALFFLIFVAKTALAIREGISPLEKEGGDKKSSLRGVFVLKCHPSFSTENVKGASDYYIEYSLILEKNAFFIVIARSINDEAIYFFIKRWIALVQKHPAMTVNGLAGGNNKEVLKFF